LDKIDYNIAYEKYKKISIVLDKLNLKYELTGSMRRKKPKVGDIDIIIESDNEDKVREHIKKELSIAEIDNEGKFKYEQNIIIQIIVVKKENYDYNLWTSTGSKNHVKNIKNVYFEKNIEIPKKEIDIYSKINMDFILPEERE